MAAAGFATDSMYLVSTPKGTANSYYEIMHTPSDMEKIVLDWKQHPDRKVGLYTSRNGKLEIIDTEYEFPEDYKFVLHFGVNIALFICWPEAPKRVRNYVSESRLHFFSKNVIPELTQNGGPLEKLLPHFLLLFRVDGSLFHAVG